MSEPSLATEAPPRRGFLASRPRARRALIATAALALVALAAWGAATAIEPGALRDAFARVSWPWVAVAAVAYMASQVSSGLVWGVGLAAGGLAGLGRRHVLSAHWIGRGASELLPAQLGETVRYAAIKRHPLCCGAGSGWRVAGSMGAFKVIDGAVTFVVIALATAVMPLPPSLSGIRWIAAGVLVGAIAFFTLLARVGPGRIARRLPAPLRRVTESLGQGAALLRCRREALVAVGIQLTAIATRVLMIAALLHAFGIPASAALLVFALIVLSGLLPISPGGAGVREAALVPVLVASYGLGTELALAFSLGVQATVLGVSLAGAAAALVIQRLWPSAAAVARPTA